MTTETTDPAPRLEHFRLTCPSGTVIGAFYGDGATVGEVEATQPLATTLTRGVTHAT